MVRVGDVVALLRDAGELSAEPDLPSDVLASQLSGVRREDEAGASDLAWLSEKRLKADPGRVQSFQGGLLLGPASATGGKRVVACRAPKAAFAIAVARFFPSLSATKWPAVGENPIATDVRMGRNVVLAHGVVIGPDVVLGDDVQVGPGTCLAHVTVGNRVRIGAHCSIGLAGFGYERAASGEHVRFPHVGRIVIGDGVEIGSNTCVDRGALTDTVIEAGAKVDNLVHVAHNVQIGARALVIADTMLGGSAIIGADAWLAPCSAIMNQVTIGERAVIGLAAVVLKSVAPGDVIVGNPGKVLQKKESVK